MSEISLTPAARSGSVDAAEAPGSVRALGGPGRWWATVGLFAAVAMLVWIAVWIGNVHLPHDAFFPSRPGIAGGTWFEGWARWDASWYRTIVREGYVYYPGVQSSVAFWPSYPMVISLVSWAFPSIYIAGSMVTLASGAVAAVAMRRWSGLFLTRSAAVAAVVVLLLYPYGYYQYGAVYADALFGAATIGAFLLLERDRLFWAGVVGMVATAARPSGVIVAVALVLRLVEKRNAATGATGLQECFRLRILSLRDTPLLIALAGVGGWCLYLWVRFGDPLLFAAVEADKGWDQGAGPSTWLKFRLWEDIEHRAFSGYTLGLIAQGLLVLGALALVPAVKRRFGWAYAAYVLGVAGMALVATKDFQGSGRYMLAAFPALAAFGDLVVTRVRLRAVLAPLSLLFLLGLAMAFGRGSYLS